MLAVGSDCKQAQSLVVAWEREELELNLSFGDWDKEDRQAAYRWRFDFNGS